MRYARRAIDEAEVPQAVEAAFQHVVDTYASEVNKLIAVWRCFADEELGFRSHAKSSTVAEIFKHELLSGRRFFGEFLGGSEPAGSVVLPEPLTVESACERMRQLARRRLSLLANGTEAWWLEEQPFFDVTRQRIWIFWRRVLHTAHHRTQLTMYLRFLGKDVPAVYGPTADARWEGSDPTESVEAAERG